MRNIEEFMDEVRNEFWRVKKLFPSNKHQLAAFNEEAGEVTKAMLDLEQNKATGDDVRVEAVQAAAMAARVALVGDEDFLYQPMRS